MAHRPRVFTIPASAPFLPTLIGALKRGDLVPGFAEGRDSLALADATLYLPTRRACRLARDMFLDLLDGDAAILPRIVALGDIDEDEIVFAEAAAGETAGTALELPPALGGLERRMLLAQLVQKWAASAGVRGAGGSPLVANTPAAALGLADDLARLMDDMTTRQVSWDRLDGLVPEELDAYWQKALEFLKIAREHWPTILDRHGAIEAAERRDRLIAAEAARLARKTDGPVIAAGSTGSIPATAELIATIARLPHGAVVLPGLDKQLDEESWRLLPGKPRDDNFAPASGHPQFALQALLTRIGIARADVGELAPAFGRERLLSEALRPSDTTDRWRQHIATDEFRAQAAAALDQVSFIEAANSEEEALAIAIALREKLEEPGKTAALITPDRTLARRVLAALTRWSIAADDSGGDALADTPAGIFAQLAAEAALGGLEPVTLLALLKHPLLRLDGTGDARAVATLERAVLRGPRPRAGADGLKQALAAFATELEKFRRKEKSELHWSDPRTNLREDELVAASALVDGLAAALAPLQALGRDPRPLREIAACHHKVVAALSKHRGIETAFVGPDGVALAKSFDDVDTSESAASMMVAPADYAELFATALADRFVRRQSRRGVRVRILGLLEARLTDSDRVVLGGLVEGTWPPETRTDAWLSRPMRQKLGLDLPERRIGLSAHDFAQMFGASEVFLTRAVKVAGAPTVASRFVQRLAAVAGERWPAVVARGNAYLEWARALDRPHRIKPLERPAPTPPRAARPATLSVTDIENWLRDPYTIYARYILRIVPLEAVDTPPGAADRGTVIHGAIGEFTQRYAAGLPADPVAELIALGERHFAPLNDYPEARAFWWPRFRRIASWLAGWDLRRRANIAALNAEIRGSIAIAAGERTFTLRGIADRIERRADGRYAILDYKTGSARTEKQVRTGLAPQLTLEAAMLRQGGFAGIAAGASVAEVAYVTLKGGQLPGEWQPIDFHEGTPDSQADRALGKLTAIVCRFEDESEPYRSLVHPMWAVRYGDYDHLARVREWSLTGGIDEDPIE